MRLSQVVTASSAATIDFSTISGAYTNLRAVWQVQAGATGTSVGALRVQFNADATSGNYTSSSRVIATGGATSATDQAAATNGVMIANVTNAGNTSIAGSGDALFAGYAGTTWHKEVVATGGTIAGTGGGRVGTYTARWKSTVAVTQLTFSIDSTTFTDGSVITLYGLP